MRRLLLRVTVLGAAIMLGFCFCALVKSRHDYLVVRTAFKLNDPGYARFIANRVKTLEWPDANGTLMRYGVGDDSTPNRNLTLVANTPVSLADDHGETTLTLVEIRNSKAKVAYISRFDQNGT